MSKVNTTTAKLEKAQWKIKILEDMVETRTRDLYTANAHLMDLNSSLRSAITKNKELEQFAYVASHDLQEPLITINSFVKLLIAEYQETLDERGNQYLKFVEESSKSLGDVVNDLLQYSRIGVNRSYNLVDCNNLVSAVEKDLASKISECGAIIEVDTLPKIRGIETEIRMLFQNLISNAIKFCAEKTKPHIIISVKKENAWTFSIKDNGIGIAESNKEKIFTLFQRLHNKADYRGTGIGLAHCKKIVEMHGGKIWMDSNKGKGSTFKFTIPTDI